MFSQLAVRNVEPTSAGNLTTNERADVYILPPPSVRDIIDKTAEFVANCGIDYERRVMLEADAPEKFGFLFAGHAYRNYYEARLNELRGGPKSSGGAEVPDAILRLKQNRQVTCRKRALVDSREQTADIFADVSGDNIVSRWREIDLFHHESSRQHLTTYIEYDVIRLVARYVASEGATLTAGLCQRERGNPLFEFLKPPHQSHKIFEILVTAYTEILRLHDTIDPSESSPLDSTLKADPHCGSRSMQRENNLRLRAASLWSRETVAEGLGSDRASRDGVNYATGTSNPLRVEWDRFTTVEQVLFTLEDDVLPLAAPDWSKMTTPVNPVSSESAAGESECKLTRGTEPSGTEKAVLPNREDDVTAPKSVQHTTIVVDGEEQKILLRPDYVRRPRVQVTARLYKCPITGQIVPAEDMSSHLKVVLLDRQWKRQRDELLARAVVDAAYAPDNDIETNIADFVLRRPDLFGSNGDEVKEALNRPMASKSKRVE